MENTISLTWKRATMIWWSFFWRSTILGALGILLMGVVFGFIIKLLNPLDLKSTSAFSILLYFLGSSIGIIASVWSMRASLLKKRKEFSVVIIKNP